MSLALVNVPQSALHALTDLLLPNEATDRHGHAVVVSDKSPHYFTPPAQPRGRGADESWQRTRNLTLSAGERSPITAPDGNDYLQGGHCMRR